MSPTKLLVGKLDLCIPGFALYAWDGDKNLFLHNDELTVHGALSAFSTYFRDNSRSLDPGQLKSIGKLISQLVGGSDGELGNAACTCFLENLAGGYPQLEAVLTGEARRYWDAWK